MGSKMTYTDQEIAIVVHEANRGFQMITDDPCPSPTWPAESQEIQASVIQGVRNARRGMTPRQLHEAWQRDKEQHGWKFGPIKDGINKTHPCMVPYDQLPEFQRTKDELFLTIVSVLASR
jgi:hypothetical protein